MVRRLSSSRGNGRGGQRGRGGRRGGGRTNERADRAENNKIDATRGRPACSRGPRRCNPVKKPVQISKKYVGVQMGK